MEGATWSENIRRLSTTATSEFPRPIDPWLCLRATVGNVGMKPVHVGLYVLYLGQVVRAALVLICAVIVGVDGIARGGAVTHSAPGRNVVAEEIDAFGVTCKYSICQRFAFELFIQVGLELSGREAQTG